MISSHYESLCCNCCRRFSKSLLTKLSKEIALLSKRVGEGEGREGEGRKGWMELGGVERKEAEVVERGIGWVEFGGREDVG